MIKCLYLGCVNQLTKRQGVLLYLSIFVIIFSGCSKYKNTTKQNEVVINKGNNNLTNEAIILSTNNTLADPEVTEQNDTPYTDTYNDTTSTYINNDADATSTYSNPIDEYFIPCINNVSTEAERRFYQDTYRGVWKSEFENILKILEEECIYQEDKDDLVAYRNSIEKSIESTQNIVVTHWLDNYNMPPDNHRNLWGNGTRSGLNQIKGEIYRDASMLLIKKMYNLNYKFIDRDYSKEHYE